MLRFLLFAQLVLVVNQLHFARLQTLIPGLSAVNLVFILTVLLVRGKPDMVKERGMLHGALLAFFAGLTLAFVWGQLRAPKDFMTDFTYWKNALFYPLFYFLYLKCGQDEKTTRQLIIAILVVAAFAGLEAFREGLSYGYDHFNPFKRASGPFGVDWRESNRAGVFFSMFMPMFVALLLFLRGQKLWRYAAAGACLVIAGGTLFTYSRQSYFMVLLSGALLFVRKSIILAVLMGVALVALAGYLPDSATQRVEETTQQGAHGGGDEAGFDDSTESRWLIWMQAVSMFGENPLGIGLNRFKGEIGNYGRYKNIDAHNFYVLTFAECGLQGLIPLLFLIYTLFRLAGWLRAQVAAEDHEARALAYGFTMSTLCVALGGLYGSPTLEGSVMAPYWALAGLLERYVYLKRTKQGAATAARPPQPALAQRFPLAKYLR